MNSGTSDPMTLLGWQAIVLASIIVFKFTTTELLKADSQNINDPSNTSYFRLHEAFEPAFSKQMSQTAYLLVIVGVLSVVNFNELHSSNVEQMLEACLMFTILWFALCTYLIYRA